MNGYADKTLIATYSRQGKPPITIRYNPPHEHFWGLGLEYFPYTVRVRGICSYKAETILEAIEQAARYQDRFHHAQN
jgi:hypothetical protein